MSETKSCPICGNNSEWRGLDPLHSKEFFRCVMCGPFTITDYALPVVTQLGFREKGLLSGIVRDRASAGQPLEIWEKEIRPILSTAPTDLLDRMDRLLINLARLTTRFGEELQFGSDRSNLGYTLDQNEFRAQIEQLVDQKLLKRTSNDGHGGKRAVTLTVEGLRKVRELKLLTGADSNKAFVAMWFDSSMDEVYEQGITKAILSCGFDPMRVDHVEHNDLIDDRIVVGLKECRFVVAEYTEHRNGVYYEAGYAHGMGKTVIMCCREEDKEGIHFDVNHRNFILYKSPEDLAERLRLRILATVGSGRNVTN